MKKTWEPADADLPPKSEDDLDARCRQAIKAVDSRLCRRARGLLAALRPNHPARLRHWQMPLRDEGGVLVRCRPDEFEHLSRLARHLELVRAEAEARLVHEQLGYVLLSDGERLELERRALGVLPADEDQRFRELCALSDFSPKHIMIDMPHFAASIRSIEEGYDLGTALSYGLLLVAGVRTEFEMIRYGRMLQNLYDRLTLNPLLSRSLARASEAAIPRLRFEARFVVLTQVQEQLLGLLPRRPGSEFRLTRILEAAQQPNAAIAADLLGHIALDAVLLARLAFVPRLVSIDRSLYLELQIDGRNVYWEPGSRAPLSCVAVQPGAKAEVYDLFPRSLHQIGVWSARQGQFTRAIKAFKQALELNPRLPETYHELGQVHLRSNQPNEAIDVCRRAIEIDPNFAEAYVTLASARLVRELFDEAIADLNQAIRLNPQLAEAYNNLGFAYQQKGETQKAIVAYQRAVRIRPDYDHALFGLGNCHLSAGQLSQAVAAYLKATRVNPEFVRAYYNLGQAYYRQRRLDEAAEAYRKVLRLDPKHAGALYNLGIVYRDQGLKDKAVEALEQAVALDPNLLR